MAGSLQSDATGPPGIFPKRPGKPESRPPILPGARMIPEAQALSLEELRKRCEHFYHDTPVSEEYWQKFLVDESEQRLVLGKRTFPTPEMTVSRRTVKPGDELKINTLTLREKQVWNPLHGYRPLPRQLAKEVGFPEEEISDYFGPESQP